MQGSFELKNPLNLFSVKTNKWFQDIDFDPVLKNDLWCNGTLILRSGNLLTKEIINKLINFGINEVEIFLENDFTPQDEINALEELKNNFIKTQNLVLFDQNEKNVKNLKQMLTFIGFKQRKIINQPDLKNFIKILNNFKPLYAFIDYDLFIKSKGKDLLKKLILPENCTIFVIYEGMHIDRNKIIDEIEGKNHNNNIKVLFKPLLMTTLKTLISKYTQNHFTTLLSKPSQKQKARIHKIFN